MFSNSNSYLGGGGAGRPGQPQYGQQYGQPQQPNAFAPQQTGFQQALQPQMTGYPAQPQLPQQVTGYPGQQQIQPQYTGYPAQNQSQYQQQVPPVPLLPQQFQPQQTGFQAQQSMPPTPPPKQEPQSTGMTSSQMANSFRSAQSQPIPSMPTKTGKIPSIRLSFITAQDQAKFEQLFKSAVGDNQAMSGDQARDLLLRSKLDGNALSDIWLHSDTTKSGQLLFPEFALAMYLCNLKLVGKTIPTVLPERITNEVSSMVDIISFSIADAQSNQRQAHVPNFDLPQQSSFTAPPMQQPQPQQPSSAQLLSSLVSQPTGYPQQPQQAFMPQVTGMVPQQTGYPINPQPMGYAGPLPPMPPMPTGFGQSQPTGMPAPLNAQPTGRPGQWGLVNAPSTGLPNIEALQSQMMPQPGREGGFTTTGLRGNATVPWAVTKDEKQIYDNLFKSWDGFGKGYITGGQSLEIFGQSGLDKPDLERIWTLSDPSNRGRLDLDEFAVAMHLIYRKLNGYPVPNRLPPELIPPSTRNLSAALGTVKSMLSRDAGEGRNSPDYLDPQRTGISYAKSRSFAPGGSQSSANRKDATVYKNNDLDVGYRSSARHRVGADGRSPSPAQSASSASERADDLSLDQLRKLIREKQVLLDAVDFQDENAADQDEALDRKDKKDADDLYQRIRRIQEDIDGNPSSASKSHDSGAERRNLKRQLQILIDRLPDLASQVRRTERNVADTRLELFRMKDAKAHPSNAAPVTGTGPGGSVTESDRLKARAKAMMQQRSAALTGKSVLDTSDDSAAATRRFEEESSRVRAEKETNDRMVRDVEEGVVTYSKSIEDSLKEGQSDANDHEKRRWEDGLGVEDEVKDFIFDMQRSSRAARVRKEDSGRKSRPQSARNVEDSDLTSNKVGSVITRSEVTAPNGAGSAGASYASYKTAEERATFIKQQAEQRMAERLAALGLKAPTKAADSTQQKQQRENKDKEDRLRQAEAEDARREDERQRRLAEESFGPPSASKASKKPPPTPPSRKNRSDSMQKQADAEARRSEQELAQKTLHEQQDVQEAQTKKLELEEQRQEEELQKEREASEARRRALEEQVRQGKVKKEEERRRKKESQKDTKEKEARLLSQRAELEEARQREAELQTQLEALDADEDTSDEDGPAQITPTDTTPTASQELSKTITPSPAAAPSIPQISMPISSPPAAPAIPITSPPASILSPASTDPETKNPFFKSMQAKDLTPQTAPVVPATETNPFHRMTQQQNGMPPSASPNPSRSRAPREEDDWSVVDSSSDDEEEDQRPRGGAKELASILFGTMGPPRPMSAMESKDTPTSPSLATAPTPATSVPLPPPMPDFNAGSPPPAPPMPAVAPDGPPAPPPLPPMSGAPPPPPMPGMTPPAPSMPHASAVPVRGALLGEIQAGRGLKKTQTKDKSQASVAGRVL